MRWLDPDWRTEAEAWIREQVDVTGPIEQPHARPWSTAMRVPTPEGDLWFKAVLLAAHAFEPALSLLLSDAFPDRVTRVLAVDAERGWMLMRDSGTRMRDVMESAADLRHWETVLPAYAEIQIALAPRASELRLLGVPDEGLDSLPGKLEALLDDDEALLLDEPEGLTSAQRREFRSRLPEVQALTEELAAFGIPETIQHDDLHDGQVFVQDGRYVISDWGDSCISHPFHTLTVTLRAIAWRWQLEPGSEQLLRLRDAYLEPYGPYASAVDIAYRTGTLARAFAWRRFVLAREPEERDRDDLESLPYGLRLFLEGGPIGTWDVRD